MSFLEIADDCRRHCSSLMDHNLIFIDGKEEATLSALTYELGELYLLLKYKAGGYKYIPLSDIGTKVQIKEVPDD